MHFTVGTRLACGFTALVLLIAAPAAGVYWWLGQVQASQAEALRRAHPATAAATRVRDGLHQALAGSRATMAADNKHFQQQRVEGWQRAEENLAALGSMLTGWPEEQRRLVERLKAELGEIQELHRAAAADIGRAEPPGIQKLANETAPLGQRMLASLNAMLDVELRLEKTPQRMELLTDLNSLRDSLHAALMQMHSYLTTANAQHAQSFDRHWSDNEAMLHKLRGKDHLLTPEQVAQLEAFAAMRSQFQSVPKQLFALRDANRSTSRLHQFTQETAQREAQASRLTAQLIALQEKRAQRAQHRLEAQSAMLAAFAVGGPAAAAILGIYIGWRVTRRFTRPLRQSVAALEALAAGQPTSGLTVEGDDEFGRMAQAINLLAEGHAHGGTPAPLPDLDEGRLRAFIQAEIDCRKPHFRPHSIRSAAAGGETGDAGYQHLAVQTQRLAQSSDQLRAQAAQMTQLMARLQQGFSAVASPPLPPERAVEEITEQAHSAQSPLTGPKSRMDAKQPVA